jgi:hypothetical protein
MRQQLDNLYVMLRSFSRVAVAGFLLMGGLYYFGLIGDVLLILATAVLVGSVLAGCAAPLFHTREVARTGTPIAGVPAAFSF